MVYDNLVGLNRMTKKMMKRINCHNNMLKVINLSRQSPIKPNC